MSRLFKNVPNPAFNRESYHRQEQRFPALLVSEKLDIFAGYGENRLASSQPSSSVSFRPQQGFYIVRVQSMKQGIFLIDVSSNHEFHQ